MERRGLTPMVDETMPTADLPGWQEEVLAGVRESQRTKNKSGRRNANIQVDYDPPMQIMLKRAAEARGIGIGSYAKRALAKQIAKDLGVDWREVLIHCAQAREYGSKPPGARKSEFGVRRTFDDGEGFGDWTN